ncbi:MAG: hypothetical protein H6642_12730 [Caldilineaceae bacterium]|nr:hypothetical protein [Caldilineaceae bacterium]MCB9139203.1 hypothetical protein [Caldilineaceae bacterium]
MANLTFTHVLAFINVLTASAIVILAFSLLAYTFTYNFRTQVARAFAIILACVMATYASDVALDQVVRAGPAERWLRFQWLGIAMLPAGYYLFSLAVLQTTNYRLGPRRWIGGGIVLLSVISAVSALFGRQIVGALRFVPPISYLEAGPLFWLFVVFFMASALLAYRNLWKARARCLTESSRKRMTYLLISFPAPGIGIFPYLITLSAFSVGEHSSAWVLLISLLVNMAVGVLIVMMAYTVAYFGVLTPDRVVRYRLVRYFMRGPFVAILVIAAIQIVPLMAAGLGLPSDVVLFSVITGVIVLSQLLLSVSKGLIDRLVYREDRSEIAWLREVDRRLLTTTDLRQFLENSLAALCELLRVPAGFAAAVVGPELMLEEVVGPHNVRDEVRAVTGWSDALNRALRRGDTSQPVTHAGYWIWPLLEVNGAGEQRLLGMLGVKARTETPFFTYDELDVLDKMIDRIARALADRKLQQSVFVSLQALIPDIDRIQELRGVVPYVSTDSDEDLAAALLNPSPIHSPEFESWVKDALSHYWGGPKLTKSPLVQLRLVNDFMEQADDDPTKALRLVLGQAIERMRPDGKPDLSAPEWLLYNILEMRFIQGRKVREIADRLAMSESDLYRKQRVAIGQVARVLSEMEQDNSIVWTSDVSPAPAEASADDMKVRA